MGEAARENGPEGYREGWLIHRTGRNECEYGRAACARAGGSNSGEDISFHEALSSIAASRILQAFANMRLHFTCVDRPWSRSVGMNSLQCLYLLKRAIVSKCIWTTRIKNALVVNTSVNRNRGQSRIMMRRGEGMSTGFHWLSCTMQVTSTGRMDWVSVRFHSLTLSLSTRSTYSRNGWRV